MKVFLLTRYLFFLLGLFLSLNTFSQHERDTLDKPIRSQDKILESVQKISSKKNLIGEALRNFVTFEKKDAGSQNLSKETFTYNQYEPFKGRVIRKIKIKVLDPFGQNVLLPDSAPPQWLQKAGNFFHIKTQQFIIGNALLFKKGQRVDPVKISETERIIRQIGYIYDAKITLDSLSQFSDSVDVLVVAQDLWSITGSVSLQNFSAAELWAITGIKSSGQSVYVNGQTTIQDVNFGGLGSKLLLTGKRNNLYPTGYNWDGEFDIANIGNTFLSSKLYRYSQPNLVNYGGTIGRSFFSPVIRWAGGLTLNWIMDAPILRTQDSTLIKNNVNSRTQSAWIGYSFPLAPSKDQSSTKRLILSASFSNSIYTKHPPDTFFQFQNNQLYLAQIGFTSRKYFKDNYLFGLGRTEDVPVGGYLAFVSGYQQGQFISGTYVGVRAGKGIYSAKTGFFYGGLQAGSLMSNSIGKSNVVTADFQYFGKLVKKKNWKFRHLYWLRYSYGEDQLLKNRLYNINDYNGIRGFNTNNTVVGNQRLTLNLEADIHMPFNILGFRFAWILFADLALLAPAGKDIFNSQLYQGYGIGLRFRNEHLLFFNTLQIQFAWYPNAQSAGVPTTAFANRNPNFYQFYQFDASQPSTIGYQ